MISVQICMNVKLQLGSFLQEKKPTNHFFHQSIFETIKGALKTKATFEIIQFCNSDQINWTQPKPKKLNFCGFSENIYETFSSILRCILDF